MADAHALAVQLAERTNAELLRMFGRLGTAEHPRGAVLAAYRNALRSLHGALGDRFTVDEVLESLRRLLGLAVVGQLRAAYAEGQRQAGGTLDAYGVGAQVGMEPQVLLVEAERALMAVVDAQLQTVRSSVAAGIASEELILGDATRLGVLSPVPVTREAAKWLTAVATGAFGAAVRAALPADDGWRKQAVATIDERTTDCCLRVHGQLQPLDGEFHLTGTPRFADHLPQPPFHWHCRSVFALVMVEDADDALTRDMREAGRLEIVAREEDAERVKALQAQLVKLGAEPDARKRTDDSAAVRALRERLKAARVRPEIHPSSAVTRRGERR